MNENKRLGLYIHIPFCKSKCIYCDFYSLPRGEEAMDRYVEALQKHLRETAALCTAYSVDTVYFGGGTPSYLGVERLKKLLKTMFQQYRVEKDAEITLEANPDSIGDRADVQALREAGVNRISLGVQSADDDQLRAIGRIHTFAQVKEAVAEIRAGGIENLSLDLIYGLPGQTMAGWEDTLEKVAALQPEHLSCYGLKVEEGTPLWDRQEALELPDDDTQADMYLRTDERLTALGYGHYEISNFARPGRESRHNMRYWLLLPYAGFGPGAHSDFEGVRYGFVRDLAGYCAGVEQGRDIFSEREEIAPCDRDAEYLMLGLRTARGVEKEEFEERFALPFSPVQAALERFAPSGLTRQENGRWRLTAEGWLVSNAIILAALEALNEAKNRD